MPLAIYEAVPRKKLVDAFRHIYEVRRRLKPRSEQELRAYERHEAAAKDFLSNLPRGSQHPTLKSLFEIGEICGLTLSGAHALFGYNLGALRECDLALNGSRTHICELYSFDRDLLIDLPMRLAQGEMFQRNALLRDLVLEWQTDIPIRTLEEAGWVQPGTFSVHVGTQDSLGSSLPPGSLAMIEPVTEAEKHLPLPRNVYLLQFGNGYRCSHCIVAGGKLRPFSTTSAFLGREIFAYPAEVRIVGRVRMFAASLPVPGYSSRYLLPECRSCADLILPWEQRNRASLLATEHTRFKRPREEEQSIRALLENELNAKLSGRTERRYRSRTSSEPHANVLIHLTLADAARYTDSVRVGGLWSSDRGRLPLNRLLGVSRIEDALMPPHDPVVPRPQDVWEARRREFPEWPAILSMKFPHLHSWRDKMLRLSDGISVRGLDPRIGPGSWLLLENMGTVPAAEDERRRSGWSRPLYALKRGLQFYCGYLEQDGDKFALVSGPAGDDDMQASFDWNELPALTRIAGIAVPI